MDAGTVLADLRRAEGEMAALRREMDEVADLNGGHIEVADAVVFRERIEEVQGRIYTIQRQLAAINAQAGASL